MIEHAGPVLQTILGTLFTWGLTALGAGLVFVFSSGQVRKCEGGTEHIQRSAESEEGELRLHGTVDSVSQTRCTYCAVNKLYHKTDYDTTKYMNGATLTVHNVHAVPRQQR